MSTGRGLYVLVTGVYALSRAAFYWLGIRFGVDYTWQHFHDVDLLRHRLWESVLYTHAFTPFINLLVGVVLKISEQHAAAIYQGIYLLLGWLFVVSTTYALAALRIRNWLIVPIVTLLFCSPAFIYFENLLHYEFIAASLVAVSGALFHLALTRTGTHARWPYWFAFFLNCALIAYVRTSFHLVWVLAMVGIALLFSWQHRRTILASAALPVLLVVALYAKNLVLFGFFGTSSWFGFNLAIVTTEQMSKPERQQWVAEGKLHPVSLIGIYRGPKAYARYVDLAATTGIPVLDRLTRSNGQPNYNHRAFIEISKLRMLGDRYYLRHRPWDYMHTVLRGCLDYFKPTSRWHPKDPDGSPHRENRAVLGPWENFYNTVWHRYPLSPLGLYLPLLVLFLYASVRALTTVWKTRGADCAGEKLVLLFAFNALYVPGLSCLVTIGELSRYRFMVEASMWIVCTWGLRTIVTHLKAYRRYESPVPSPVEHGKLT